MNKFYNSMIRFKLLEGRIAGGEKLSEEDFAYFKEMQPIFLEFIIKSSSKKIEAFTEYTNNKIRSGSL